MSDERVEEPREERQGGEERFSGDDKDRRAKPRFFRKKVCRFCTGKQDIDYKDIDTMKRYVTERGKILPARITGCCARHQRSLTTAIKRCRYLGWLPFVG